MSEGGISVARSSGASDRWRSGNRASNGGDRAALCDKSNDGPHREPEDIANAIIFLASPKSGWITAQMLTVDGGRMDYIGYTYDGR